MQERKGIPRQRVQIKDGRVKEEKGRDPIKEKHFGKLEQLSIIIYPLIAPS
jgi:hypothetical protein